MEAQKRKEYLQELAYKMKQGGLTDKEQAFFDSWYNDYADDLLELPEGYVRNPTVIRDRMLAKLKQRVKAEQTPVVSIFWLRTAAAASILLCLGLGLYEFTSHKDHSDKLTVAKNKVLDLPPGSNQATLTLAGGRKIILTNKLQGQIAVQGNTKVQVSAGGAIAYNAANNTETTIAYNTLSTTRGQQSPMPLILSDGTKVWLNAASSITFPTTFNDKNREVKITGEVYFEVIHNADRSPLRIVANGQVVEDIGTRFDINAYEDEPFIKTTLLEGSVKLSARNLVRTLQPGQQAQVKDGMINVMSNANTEKAIAWKNGQFMFDNDNIQYIMRTISRWYNVDVVYSGAIPDYTFGGGVSRFSNVSEVLKMFQLTGNVHFKIDGRKITVTK